MIWSLHFGHMPIKLIKTISHEEYMMGITALAVDPKTWWRYQMATFSALLSLCDGDSLMAGEFPSQRPVTRSFDVFFDLSLNKRLANHRDSGDLIMCKMSPAMEWYASRRSRESDVKSIFCGIFSCQLWMSLGWISSPVRRPKTWKYLWDREI